MIATKEIALDFFFILVSEGVEGFNETDDFVRRHRKTPGRVREAGHVLALMLRLAPREVLLADANLKIALHVAAWKMMNRRGHTWRLDFSAELQEFFPNDFAEELARRTCIELDELRALDHAAYAERKAQEYTTHGDLLEEVSLRFPFATELRSA